ncbi:CYTH domain-containing protein [Sphingomonas sp. NCPPB 2930]
MAIEIERKFLVTGDAWRAAPGTRYSQGYLNRDKARTVRVRIAGDQGFLTIKGVSVGATRAEFEYPVPLADAQEMLSLCDGPVVQKTRHRVVHDGLAWEVDAFLGDNAGLVVAEIELASENQAFALPDWVGREVTGDPRYFNSSLAVHPFSAWGPGG